MRGRRGTALVEMTMVGIPIMFTLLSIFEISRGMWLYETMAYACKAGIRYAATHGENCRSLDNIVNSCDQTANQIITNAIGPAAVGVIPAVTTVTFLSADGTSINCQLDGSGTGGCGSDWPPASANAVGQTIQISMKTPFQSAIAMFWPGSSPVSVAATQFTASSQDIIQF
jgi:hypothetical protein